MSRELRHACESMNSTVTCFTHMYTRSSCLLNIVKCMQCSTCRYFERSSIKIAWIVRSCLDLATMAYYYNCVMLKTYLLLSRTGEIAWYDKKGSTNPFHSHFIVSTHVSHKVTPADVFNPVGSKNLV